MESGQTSSTSLVNLVGSLDEGPSLHPAYSIEEGQSLRLGSMEEEPSLHLACSTEEGLSSLHLGSMEASLHLDSMEGSSLHLADSMVEGASSTVAVELAEQMERTNINNNKRPSAQPRNRNAGHQHHFHPHLRNVNPSITNATFSMRESLVEEHLRRTRAIAFSMQQQRHLFEQQQLHLLEQQQHLLEQQRIKHSMHAFSTTPQPRLRPGLPLMLAINAPATATTSSNAVAANAPSI